MNGSNIHYFFAAANGYNGFVSYFEKVFSPSEFDKIFILKGGPGTGKSRMMKDVIEKFINEGVICEAVLCSSDPKSLDGIILEREFKKIAIIDGTAPHATDPIYPGVVEKIVNLGDFWNESLLKNNSIKIKELCNCKKNYYYNAYQYLSVAKKFSDIVYKSISSVFLNTHSEVIKTILSDLSEGEGKRKIRLKSAFGKEGFFDIQPIQTNKLKSINIVGIYGSEYLFMNEIYNKINDSNIDFTISPSPLCQDKIDEFFFESNNLRISVGNKIAGENTTIIDTSKFIDIKRFETIRNKLETLYKEREAMLWCATDEFKKAYDVHMELEKLYTASMNFKKNKKMLDKICVEITEILFPEKSDIN